MAHVTKLKSGDIGYYKYYTDVILGKGNFATVYLARHRLLGCEVALKAISINDIEEDYVYRNLHREAQILRELRHPNIIRLYETVSTVKLYCLSMELIRGANLYQFLRKQEDHRISEKLARVFFYQMLSAVEYMHRLHYIHRDLKLENILIEYGHVIKIADFGLSNSYFPSFELRTHCGSVEYAAPELFKSASYGTAADLWSLGVVLYAMVVGKMPFIYNRGKLESAENLQLRQRFIQRISKGLMQENWELMEDLSPDCWNLLHDLLQPDQFRRIRIEDALSHHWITKDIHLKERLPQKRKDLQRKFHAEIIEYLADKLNTSSSRIEKHLNAHLYDRIACMFYIVRDVLVKEVLYPPTVFQTSFLYRFECWRQNRKLLTTVRHSSQGQSPVKDRYFFLDKFLASSSSKTDNKIQFSSRSLPKSNMDNHKLKSDSNTNLTESTRIREQKSAKNHSQNAAYDVDPNSIPKAEESVCRKPYRSYKNSRPQNKQNLKDSIYSDSPNSKRDVNKKSNSQEKEKLVYKTSDAEKNEQESYSAASNTGKTKQLKSLHTVLKHSTNKTPKTDKKTRQTEIRTNSNLSENNYRLVYGLEADKGQEKTIKAKNANSRDALPKRTEGNGIKLLTRTQQPATNHKTDEVIKSIHKESPIKFMTKSVRYGPPAPFSQPRESSKIKTKSTASYEVNCCRGDTNEGVQE